MINTLVDSIYENSYDTLNYTANIFNESNESKFILNDSQYYSSILFYYSQLYFDSDHHINFFWEQLGKSFSFIFIINYFPINTQKNWALDYLNQYLKDLMLYKYVKPNTLYSLLLIIFINKKQLIMP